MKKYSAVCVLMMCLAAATAFAAKPTKVLGAGMGLANFRVAYHQVGDVTLNKDTVYYISGWYFVDSTYSMTIQPGTLILGDTASAGSLIIKRGAKIHAAGTLQHPIVFTSMREAGRRAPGDWGGVVILGMAPTNQSTNQQIEGGFGTIANSYAGYGGTDPNDNSGELQYVRIEFAGIAFAQDNEINGLTFGGVGSGTTVHHVQVSFANDDDFEFFGGTVQAKYLVGWRSLDDCFDTDFGFDGKLQFMYTKRDPLIFDNSASGQSNGEESDNNGTNPYLGYPTTKARFSNWTLIGPTADSTTTISAKWGHAALLRRGTHLSIHNSIMGGWKMGINLRDTLTQNAALQDSLQLRHISLAAPWNGTNGSILKSSSPATINTLTDPVGWFNNAAWGNIGALPVRQASALGLPAAVWNLDTTNNPIPTPGSEAATAGTGYYGTNLQGDVWYDSVSYRGAFDPSNQSMSQQWTAGWTNFGPENYDPQQTTTITTSVGTPWNMVAVSVVPSTFDAATLFPGKSGTMWGFNNGTLAPATTLANGKGYWVKYTASGSNAITGSAVSGSSVSAAGAGWVLLGSMTTPVNVSSLITVPAGAITGTVWRFNSATQGYLPTTVVNPGDAVWVKVNQACTITFP